MKISDYDFELPEERIAQTPAPERDRARLMTVERRGGGIGHAEVRDLPWLLRPGDLLIFNDTRVFPARLFGVLDGTRRAEALFLRPVGEGEWLLLVRPSRKVRPGSILRFEGAGLEGEAVRRGGEGEWVVRFSGGEDVDRALDGAGEVPLPPYIRRRPDESDRTRYQTVFARTRGSIAAPTAGLHFTESLLEDLDRAGIRRARVTLHVGPGTFRPVRAEEVEDHRMEEEEYRVPEETAEAVDRVRREGGRVVAVGTTVVRALETVARGDRIEPGTGWTRLFLHPPAKPRVTDGLLTNFHLPRSTLFLLVCAFTGADRMIDAYRYAVGEGYRFYSYGDCMLIL
ncbi:MAG: tRNA preQ1(34) S-adenosylmethionine ribosyltransferase-isomerase QueA [Candidatus Eisenbacteria bacterium]|nr:tRNA preQ1(34) S-adenosylmethionine ribosyltransferase-isomerase QueA [Candidatus Eisenbacteria bacterium]